MIHSMNLNSKQNSDLDQINGIEDYVLDEELEDIQEIGMEMEDEQEMIQEEDDGGGLYDDAFAPL